jgi:hypothetical protein
VTPRPKLEGREREAFAERDRKLQGGKAAPGRATNPGAGRGRRLRWRGDPRMQAIPLPDGPAVRFRLKQDNAMRGALE